MYYATAGLDSDIGTLGGFVALGILEAGLTNLCENLKKQIIQGCADGPLATR